MSFIVSTRPLPKATDISLCDTVNADNSMLSPSAMNMSSFRALYGRSPLTSLSHSWGKGAPFTKSDHRTPPKRQFRSGPVVPKGVLDTIDQLGVR